MQPVSRWVLASRRRLPRQVREQPRVIEQTVREKLPEGFQRAEFLVDKGAIDLIVDRRKLKDELARLLAHLTGQPAPTG